MVLLKDNNKIFNRQAQTGKSEVGLALTELSKLENFVCASPTSQSFQQNRPLDFGGSAARVGDTFPQTTAKVFNAAQWLLQFFPFLTKPIRKAHLESKTPFS